MRPPFCLFLPRGGQCVLPFARTLSVFNQEGLKSTLVFYIFPYFMSSWLLCWIFQMRWNRWKELVSMDYDYSPFKDCILLREQSHCGGGMSSFAGSVGNFFSFSLLFLPQHESFFPCFHEIRTSSHQEGSTSNVPGCSQCSSPSYAFALERGGGDTPSRWLVIHPTLESLAMTDCLGGSHSFSCFTPHFLPG